MSDDTRQARIEAGDASDNTHPPLQKNENRTILSDPDLRIDVRVQDDYLVFGVVRNPGTVHMHGHHIPIALAADAIGRERVSEAEAHKLIADIDMARMCRDYGWELDAKARVIALLTAAPAERGHDETGEKP